MTLRIKEKRSMKKEDSGLKIDFESPTLRNLNMSLQIIQTSIECPLMDSKNISKCIEEYSKIPFIFQSSDNLVSLRIVCISCGDFPEYTDNFNCNKL